MTPVTLVLASGLLLVLIGFLAKHLRKSKLPGPQGIPYFGNVFHMAAMNSKDIIPKLTNWFKKYGGIYQLEIFGIKYILVAEPEAAKAILSSSTQITKGSFEYSFFKPLFNDGLLVSDGDKWRTRRKLLTPSFHFKILETSLEGMNQNAEEFVLQLLTSGGKPVEIGDIIYQLSLKMICETAMGVKLNTEDKEQSEYIASSKVCHDGLVYRYLRFWLFSDITYRLSEAGKNFFKCADTIHNFADKVIRNRKETFKADKIRSQNRDSSKKERNAFLDNLLELDDSNPGLFTEADIREEVDTFMIAGHNPSAAILKFLHFVLANHPEVQEKVYDEQMEIFGEDKRVPTKQDLQKMIYLEMVIKETLRLYPSIPFYSRSLKEDLQIDENTTIPAGYSVVVLAYSIHRSENHWTDPEEFIPERFAPGIERHPFSFIPFSAGPRNCIGQKYAMMELMAIMSAVVRRCWLEPVTTSVTMDYGITLHPVEPIIIKVFPRNQHQIRVSQAII